MRESISGLPIEVLQPSEKTRSPEALLDRQVAVVTGAARGSGKAIELSAEQAAREEEHRARVQENLLLARRMS